MKNYLDQVIARIKALKPAQRVALLAALPVVVFVITSVSLAGGGSGQPTQPVLEVPVPATSSADYDPYSYYLEHNPDPTLVLSAQDAATRAMLGCSYPEEAINSFPIDKVLREAYGPTGICDAQG